MFDARLIDDDIVEIVFHDKVYLDVSVTDKVDEALISLAPDRKLFQLVIAKGPFVVNPEMRNSFTKGDTGIRQLAIAWVSPDHGAIQQEQSITEKLPLPLPLQFFTDRESGLAWLRSLRTGNNNT